MTKQLTLISTLPVYFMPLSLSAVVGLPSMGKTALCVLKCVQAHIQGYKLYSNTVIHDEYGKDLRAPDGRLDSDDPNKCLEQLQDLFFTIRDESSWNVPRYLFLSEFSSIADAQDWKKYSWTSQIWKQLGKMGITGDVDDQNFSRIYDGYRKLVVYKYIVSDIDVDGAFVPKPWCNVVLGRQSPNDHEVYTKISDFYVNLSPVFPLYNRHQLMYFGQSKRKGK